MRQPAKGDRQIHTPHSAARLLNDAAYLLGTLLTKQGHPLAAQVRKLAATTDDLVDTLAPTAPAAAEPQL